MTVQQNHTFTSPLRYPGGKGTLANFIKLVISRNALLDGEYVELYAGGASIAWSLLFEEYVRRVHVNDLDSKLMAFWQSVLADTEALCRLIQDTPVTMEEWYRQRAIQDRPQDHTPLEVGFSIFYLNRTNRSGIIRGGVIGGKSQSGVWKLDARFNKPDLVRRIHRIARYAGRIKLYNVDAAHFIETVVPTLPQKTVVYLDPPYFKKGHDLYENHYQPEDHAQVAHLVSHHIRQPWIVSYDATPEIMEMYAEHPHVVYGISYSAQDRYMGSEVLFHSSALQLPEVLNPAAIKLPKFARLLL